MATQHYHRPAVNRAHYASPFAASPSTLPPWTRSVGLDGPSTALADLHRAPSPSPQLSLPLPGPSPDHYVNQSHHARSSTMANYLRASPYADAWASDLTAQSLMARQMEPVARPSVHQLWAAALPQVPHNHHQRQRQDQFHDNRAPQDYAASLRAPSHYLSNVYADHPVTQQPPASAHYLSTPANTAFPNPPISQTYPIAAAPYGAPAGRLLNPPPLAIPPPNQSGWAAEPTCNAPPTAQTDGFASHTALPVPAGVPSTSPKTSSASGWANPDFCTSPEDDSGWMAVQRPSVHVDQRQAVELDQPAPYPVHRPLIGQAQVHLSQRPLEEIGTMAASRPTKRKASCDKEKPRMHSSFRPRAKKTQTGYRKGKMTESGKAKASRMRKFGVCLRCKIYKAPCDTDDECHSCAKVSGSARIFKFRCSRAKLSDVVLARHSNGRFNQWQADYRRDYDWSMNYYDVDMLWNLPGVGPLSVRDGIFRLQIREYIPSQNEDTTTYRWVNVAGQSVGFEQPPYAVYDTNGFEAAFRPWLAVLMPMIEQRGILDRVQNDDIALLTFREAMRMRTSSNLLDSALKLLCLSLASQGYGTVFSNNVPGIHEVDHKSMGRTAYETYNRDSRDRPLPTAIAHTVDVGILRLLKIYQDHCLKAIGDKIFKVNNNKPWFELFIAMFVLLWNMEYVLNSAERYIGCKDRTVHGSQVRSTVQKQIDEYRASFPNLLEHWTIFLRGFAPFQMARGNPEELRTMSQMDDSSFIYTMQVVSIIDRKGAAHYPPPHTSPLPTMNEWIGKLLKSAGAWP